MKTRLTLLVALTTSVAGAACTKEMGIRNAMVGAPTGPNPAEGGDLHLIPEAKTHHDLGFRLISHTEDETCMNGDVAADPHLAQGYTFLLRSYATPDDAPESVPTAKSTSVKVLSSDKQYVGDHVEPVTVIQVCFGRPNVISKSTAYLVLQRDPDPPFAAPLYAVWHFDSSVRHLPRRSQPQE